MRTKAPALLVVLVLAAVTLGTVWRTLPPAPLPATAPPTEFSAARAMDHVRSIAARPRPSGSPAYDAARDYVLAALRDLGLRTEVQRSGDLQNVIGWIEGHASPDTVLLTAHLDSESDSPGAADDASGVAVLLETARALQAGHRLRHTVMFLFSDAEEEGFLGAQAFIARHPAAGNVKIVIGVDAGGVGGPGVLSATSARDGWLVRQLARADAYGVGSSAINALADSRTDFGHAFRAAGFSGYAFDLYWDQRTGPDDRIEALSPASLQHQGYHALALARHLGNADSLTDPHEPDAVYFSLLRLFTVHYPTTWAAPIGLAATVALGALLAYGLRRKVLSWAGMGYGAGILLALAAMAAAQAVLVGLYQGAPGRGAAFAARALGQPVGLGVEVAAALAVVGLMYWGFRRLTRAGWLDLAVGALAAFGVCMLGTCLWLPVLSYAPTWPLLCSLLAVAGWLHGSSHQRASRAATVGLLISVAASIITVGPVIVLGLFDQAPLSLATLGALCGLLVPQVHLALERQTSLGRTPTRG